MFAIYISLTMEIIKTKVNQSPLLIWLLIYVLKTDI